MGAREAQVAGSKRNDWVMVRSPGDSGIGTCTGNTKRKKKIEKLKRETLPQDLLTLRMSTTKVSLAFLILF